MRTEAEHIEDVQQKSINSDVEWDNGITEGK